MCQNVEVEALQAKVVALRAERVGLIPRLNPPSSAPR